MSPAAQVSFKRNQNDAVIFSGSSIEMKLHGRKPENDVVLSKGVSSTAAQVRFKRNQNDAVIFSGSSIGPPKKENDAVPSKGVSALLCLCLCIPLSLTEQLSTDFKPLEQLNLTTIDDLPEDILESIFATLSVKWLLRLTNVRRYYRSMIRSASFRKFYSQFNSETELSSVIVHECPHFSVRSAETFELVEDLNLPHHHSFMRSCIVQGSCQGLLCLSSPIFRLTDNLFLYNPSLRKLMRLPRIQRSYFKADHITIGLGYLAAEAEDDFQVVCLVQRGTDFMCQLFSLKSMSWANVQPTIGITRAESVGASICYNGRLFWPLSTVSGVTILTFDLKYRVFERSNLPNEITMGSILVAPDSLRWVGPASPCLLMRPREDPLILDCDKWVLNQSNWTNSGTIRVVNRTRIGVAWPLGINHIAGIDGDIVHLLMTYLDGTWHLVPKLPISYPLLDQVNSMIPMMQDMFVDGYRESLVLLTDMMTGFETL